MKHSRIATFCTAIAVGLSTGASPPALADDTEIYLTGGNVTGGDVIRPNVLFVLDTSSSMTGLDGGSVTRLDRMKDALQQILDSANNINVGLMRFHRYGGPVLYPVAYIDEDATVIEPAATPQSDVQVRIGTSADDAEELAGTVDLQGGHLEMTDMPAGGAGSTTVEVRVVTGNDDAEEQGNGASNPGNMYLTSSDLELVSDGSRGEQIIGIRFQAVAIPQGAVITGATIEFEIDEQQSTATDLTLYGQDIDDAPGFSNSANNISSRVKTDALVAWSGLPAPSINQKLTTPDIKTLVQEIVNRAGWVSGNDMAFIIQGTGKRTVESYNGESSAAPRLRVTYASGAGGAGGDQIIGLRFQTVDIPQGVTIESATIEFEGATAESGVTDLTFAGHDVDDSPAFAATTNQLSNRLALAGTTARVDWNGVPAWSVDNKYQSPDLTSVVQEVVNRGGWCGGNAMTILVSVKPGGTSGSRTAESYDGESGNAPVLRVNYDETSAPTGGGCINQSLQAQVATGNDDAEESAGGTVGLTSSDLELVNDGNDQTIGIRFRNLNIPQGATILEASLEFTVDETGTSATSITIRGEDNDDTAAFSGNSNDISSRPVTSASTPWTIQPWSSIGQKDQSPDLASIVQEIVDRPSWASGNSMAFIISGTGRRTAESYNGSPIDAAVLRVKIQGALGTGTTANLSTVRGRLKQIVDEIQYKSGTPIVDTLYEAARYFRGEAVDYGLVRGDQGSRSEFTRVSHPASYEDATGVQRDAGCTDANLNATACITEAVQGPAKYLTPMSAGCQANYIILLSDGSPSVNTSVTKVENMINAPCAGSGAAKCGKELVSFLQNQDQSTTLPDNQTITTYTIGFNFAGDQFLKDLAQLGGGSFYEASTAGDLANVFQSIIADILSRTTSFAAPALSVNAFNKLFHLNDVYFSLFKPTSKTRWDGNVKKYRLCDNSATCTLGEILDANGVPAIGADDRIKGDATSFWSSVEDGDEITVGGAAANVPGYTARTVYTYTGSASSPTSPVSLGSGTDHLVALTNPATVLTKDMLGNADMSDQARSDLIEWIRGKDVGDEDGDSVTAEDRYRFNDPLHSSPVAVTFGKEANDAAKPVVKVFVGTNDGGVRMLNGETGVEEWIFYPRAMLAQQQELMTNANGNHLYGMDGTPTLWIDDTDRDGVIEPADGDFVRLIIGMRRGGASYYALDVTPGSVLTDQSAVGGIVPKFMWRIDGGAGDFARLGDTWSGPAITDIRVQGTGNGNSVAKTVLVFGGGYNELLDDGFATSTTKGNAIYIVDPADGSRIWWTSNTGSGASLELAGMDYAIPSDLALIDGNGDGETDRIYVGDTGGQVWRIDLGALIDTNSNGGSSGARLAILSENPTDPAAVSTHRRFFSPPDVVQLIDPNYSDQARYDLVVIVSGNRPAPLSKEVYDRAFALRDYAVEDPIASNFTPLTASDLYDATDDLLQAGNGGQKSQALADLKGADGWYINLKDGSNFVGEKGLSKPVILAGTVFITTYLPDAQSAANTCQAAEGGGRLYAMDVTNGAAVYNYDQVGDANNLTQADRVYTLGSGIPSDAVPIFQPEGVQLLIGTSGGATTVDPSIQLPKALTYWFQ